jgi:hypothetical protein
MSGRRFTLFAIVFVVVVVWVSASDGEHASMARHLLRGLLRSLF